MGRLSDYFDSHRDNVEEGVKKALGKADDTLEVLRKRLEEVEAKLREIAGEAPQQSDQATTDRDLNAQNAGAQGVVTSDQTGNSTESVAAQADKSARQTRTKK